MTILLNRLYCNICSSTLLINVAKQNPKKKYDYLYLYNSSFMECDFIYWFIYVIHISYYYIYHRYWKGLFNIYAEPLQYLCIYYDIFFTLIANGEEKTTKQAVMSAASKVDKKSKAFVSNVSVH